MKHDPVDLARSLKGASAKEDIDRRVDALLATLPPCPGLPWTEAEIAASDARALADVAAGRVYPHAVVVEWLETRGAGISFKDWIAARDG